MADLSTHAFFSPPACNTRLHLHAGAVLAVAILVGACSDSYPTDSEPVLTPAEMSQSQRLERLNDIGGQSYLEVRWKYKLTQACELKVSKGRLFAKESAVIPLAQGRIVKSKDRLDQTHDVHLQGQDASVPLLESANWVDSVAFFSLVSHLQRDCVTVESA